MNPLGFVKPLGNFLDIENAAPLFALPSIANFMASFRKREKGILVYNPNQKCIIITVFHYT